jgi:hypothetical protein
MIGFHWFSGPFHSNQTIKIKTVILKKKTNAFYCSLKHLGRKVESADDDKTSLCV